MTQDVVEYRPPSPLPGFDDIEVDARPVLEDMSVVIPTLGRAMLERCLASMVASDAWPACIVVVDQGSDDKVERMLERVLRFGIATNRIVAPPRGRARAVNLGLAAVATPYVAITDDDCVVAPDWLRAMRESLERRPGCIVTGRVEDVGDEAPVAIVLGTEPVVQTKPSLMHDRMSGGNSGMAMSLHHRIGPFDEDPRLRLAEDTEYAYRALRTGATLVYVPDVRIWHYAWRDEGQRENQFRGYARSHGGYYGKYIRRGDSFIALKASIHLMRAWRRWVVAVARGDANRAANAKAYALGLVPGMIEGFRREASNP